MNAESAGKGKDLGVEAFCSLCLQLRSVGWDGGKHFTRR